jgi:hypothetical protein
MRSQLSGFVDLGNALDFVIARAEIRAALSWKDHRWRKKR